MGFEIKEAISNLADEIIETRKPLGLFYYREYNNIIIGIDNSTGDAWIEEFNNLEECKKWLIGEEATDRFGIIL